jgi:hypothetical protein
MLSDADSGQAVLGAPLLLASTTWTHAHAPSSAMTMVIWLFFIENMRV